MEWTGNREIDHKINVGNATKIELNPRQISFHYRELAWKKFKEMKDKKIIDSSNSFGSSPVVLVKRKDGDFRFCQGYRQLNAITIKDSISVPLIVDLLDYTVDSSWFSTIDSKTGYWQISLEPTDREKEAFAIGNELWQYRVWPFGLCNAPALFLRIMSKVLQELLNVCLVYLHDIIVLEINLKVVFTGLTEGNLKVNDKKCHLFQKEVFFLGHIVNSEEFHCQPEKIKWVSDWIIPTEILQLQSFLGLCLYYRKLIPNSATIAKPLHKLTKKNKPIIWNTECDLALHKLKR